jgi:hypothetical protein
LVAAGFAAAGLVEAAFGEALGLAAFGAGDAWVDFIAGAGEVAANAAVELNRTAAVRTALEIRRKIELLDM